MQLIHPARLARCCRALRTDRSGVALIEFAFSLPILLSICMVGVETANLAITILRVNQLAMLAADNTARVRSSIDENDIEEVIAGLRFAGSGIKFGERGRVIISTLESNGETGNKAGFQITWQRCFGKKNVTSSYGVAGQGSDNASLAAGMGPTGKKVRPVTNSALIFAEVRYNYVPVVPAAFMSGMELSALQSFTVRDRASQTLTNTSGKTVQQQRLCDAAHLSET